jgi:hypothetical protein
MVFPSFQSTSGAMPYFKTRRKGDLNLKSQKSILITLLVVILVANVFLVLDKVCLAQEQSGILFNDDFDTKQPNPLFTIGSNDSLNDTAHFSSPYSLQVYPTSSPYSSATFIDTTGQLYVQMLYSTNTTGYSRIATFSGNAGWIGVYQDANGVIFDWDYNANITNILLTPNVWYNITLSLYLDPDQGSNSSATLWLNQTIIASQSMPQVDGYDLNTLTFEPSSNIQAIDNYDDIIISTQPISSTIASSPTPTPIPAPTSTTTISSTNPTAIPTPARTPNPSSFPSPTAVPSSAPTIPEIPFVLAIPTFLIITGLMLFYLKKHYSGHSFFP